MLPSDTVVSATLLREAARKAAQRADEAGDDLGTVYASIEDAYAALDALYSCPDDVRFAPCLSTFPEISPCTRADISQVSSKTPRPNEGR